MYRKICFHKYRTRLGGNKIFLQDIIKQLIMADISRIIQVLFPIQIIIRENILDRIGYRLHLHNIKGKSQEEKIGQQGLQKW